MSVPRREGVALATGLALVAFAANSILCRLALADGEADAVGFTVVRLAAGAAALALIVRLRKREGREGREGGEGGRGSWRASAALLVYAAGFSFAYLRIPAGTGALVLFAAVQVTMIGGGILGGHRPRPREWIGLALAALGVVVMALPGLGRPDPGGVFLMAGAGAAWGAYSLLGRSASRPLIATADNFLRTLPAAAVLLGAGALAGGIGISSAGFALAATSGALASGVGYALWYAALPGLTPSRAAILQLLVPVLAAAGGVALLGETVTARFLAAGAAVIAGVTVANARGPATSEVTPEGRDARRPPPRRP